MLKLKGKTQKEKCHQKSKNLLLITFYFCLFTFAFLNFLFADDINFNATVDRNKVSLGSSIQLSLNFYGSQKVSAPELGDLDGFEWQYLGPSTRMSIVNGQVSNSITHMYMLVPMKEGKLEIPSFSVDFDGKVYKSDPIPIEVIQGQAAPAYGASGHDDERATSVDQAELKDRIFMMLSSNKKIAYVGEIITITIRLYVHRLAIRDIQYPTFAHEGFQVDKFAEPKQYQDSSAGVLFDVIEFNTNVFATREGKLRLGPAELKCNLVVKQKTRRPRSFFDDDFFGGGFFDDFFGTTQTHPLNLQSLDLPITILPLPEEDKPKDFTGAIGNYRFEVEALPDEVKVGDPITLKMIVTGSGNFNTVDMPKFKAGENFKTYEPEIKQQEYSKTFSQVIIPKSDKVSEIPPIVFSFFDTTSGQYQTIEKGPIPIKVNPLPKGEELKVYELPQSAEALPKKEELGRDIIYIKENLGDFKLKAKPLCKNNLLIVILFIPLLAIAGVFIFEMKKERLQADVGYARRLHAPRAARKNLAACQQLLDSKDANKFFDAVFKTLQEYLGDKFHLPTAGITSNVVEEHLRPRKIDENILAKISSCFSDCDMARYAPSSITKEKMQETFKLLREIIESVQRMKI